MRDLGKDAEMVPNKTTTLEDVISKNPKAIILSGGPSSVTSGENYVSEEIVKKISDGWDVPLLGLCWGHQVIAYTLGGEVEKGPSAEYGLGKIFVDEHDLLFREIPGEFTAWVSHFDEIKVLPKGFVSLAHSDTCKIEAMRHKEKRIFGCQFHPEVRHTEHGEEILKNFLSSI